MSSNRAESIILVGGGPSSRLFFSRLDSIPANLSVFCTGPSFRIYRTLSFVPDYWALMDSKVVLSLDIELADALQSNELARTVFLPSEAVSRSSVLRSAIARTSSTVKLSRHSQTGTFALQRIIDVSARQIFIIGLEGQYVEKISSSSPASISKKLRLRGLPYANKKRQINEYPVFNPNYWSDNYQQPNDVYSLPRSSDHKNSLQKQISRAKDLGIEVLNLSPISNLNAPFVIFQDLISGKLTGD